jgi:hypothetical protein
LDDDIELSFVIKNLDTGEQVDARDESHIEYMLASLSNPIKELNSKATIWKGFWDKAKEVNELLWDAGTNLYLHPAEIGNREVVISLV